MMHNIWMEKQGSDITDQNLCDQVFGTFVSASFKILFIIIRYATEFCLMADRNFHLFWFSFYTGIFTEPYEEAYHKFALSSETLNEPDEEPLEKFVTLKDDVGNLFIFDHRDTVPAGSTLRLICEIGESTTLIWYYGDGAVLASYVYCVDSTKDHTKFPGRIYSTCNFKLRKSSLTIYPVKPSDGRFNIVCKTDEHASMVNITVFRSAGFVDIDVGNLEAFVNEVTLVECPLEKEDELKYWKINDTLITCGNTSKSNSQYYIAHVTCNNQFSEIAIKFLTEISKLTVLCINQSGANVIVIAASAIGMCLLILFIAIIAILKFTDGLCFKKLKLCDGYLNKDQTDE
ncbi:XP_036359033.1uncharacterized protein LOC118763564 [Octopus vulgaris]|uniref:XP_036359033.1uncharacterized protein LOC118763564 n=1 Tax=Octopus vulgaris TaxID=6645 RepID=A0AA36F445_OCTVU|nr:XP_036359033.1uncharacterized protein LOC118763564 [Octopus vulgaris]